MANGSKNKITLFAGIEATYGGSVSTMYQLNRLTDNFKNEVTPVFNEAGMGSTHNYNNYTNDDKWTAFDFEVKIDENTFPLFFAQKYSFASGLISGDAGAYEHVLSYSNSNFLKSLRFALIDPDRGTEVYKGALISSIVMNNVKGQYQTLTVTGIAQKSEDTADTYSIADSLREFVGRNVTNRFADFGDALANYEVITANHNLTFELSGLDINAPLGTDTLNKQFIMGTDYNVALNVLMANKDIRDKFNDATKVQFESTIADTREIVGSTDSNTPSIVFNYPVGVINEFTPREGEMREILRQSFTMSALDMPSVATAPLQITVRNNVASY